MLTIRLQRVGRRKFATFRMVVTEHTRQPQSGKYVELVGWWNPHTNQADIEKDRVSYWLSVGAQPTDTVHNLLVDAGVIAGKKRNVLPKKHAPQTQVKGGAAQATPTAVDAAQGESVSSA
ncbi:30S ribosomal protein S16 [Candidatus Parcubacteria bacterium]|nr:MAG: 30S ribosomal protein S16 [Candidatus Parcubacteria bacterium]